MTATTLDRPRAGDTLVNLSAWCMIAGAALTFVGGIPFAAFEAQIPPPWWIATLNAVSHPLLIAGVIGLARSGAAGRGRLATTGVGLTLLGLVVLTVAEVLSLINMDTAVLFYSAATLLMLLGLILLGIAALRAGRWTGWRRFTPLVCGLFIPVVLLPSFALPGLASNYAIGVWGVCWLMLGLALLVETA
jgi:hypothetical protein